MARQTGIQTKSQAKQMKQAKQVGPLAIADPNFRDISELFFSYAGAVPEDTPVGYQRSTTLSDGRRLLISVYPSDSQTHLSILVTGKHGIQVSNFFRDGMFDDSVGRNGPLFLVEGSVEARINASVLDRADDFRTAAAVNYLQGVVEQLIEAGEITGAEEHE